MSKSLMSQTIDYLAKYQMFTSGCKIIRKTEFSGGLNQFHRLNDEYFYTVDILYFNTMKTTFDLHFLFYQAWLFMVTHKHAEKKIFQLKAYFCLLVNL